MRTLLVLLCLLLLVPPVQAAPIQLEPDSLLLLETTATLQPGVFEYVVRFQVDANRTGYLKVLPVPGNPVYNNGTVGGPGWWTEALRGGATLGQSNGTQLIDLGALATGRHEIQLRVHSPAGAVQKPNELRMRYALAVRGDATGGSGGNLDPSISVQPILRVQEAAQQTDGQDAQSSPGARKLSIDRNVIIAVVALAAVGLVFWLGRASAKGGRKG